MIINAETHPHIIKAMNCVEEETRGMMAIPQPVREIPNRWGAHLEKINAVIGTLSTTERAPESEPLPAHVRPDAYLDSELYSFCNGEYHEMKAIENRNPDLGLASLFLNDFFEDWTLTGDDEKTSPQNVANQRRLEWLESIRTESGMGLQDEQLEEYERLRLSLV
jgi:hypothetical protein